MLLYLTEQSTVEIIGDEYNPSAHASIVALEFSSIVYCVRNLVLLVNIPNAFLAGGGTIMAFFGGILNPHGFMYEFGHAMHAIELIEVETVWCTPLILLVILMLIGVHGLLSIRYFMVLLWAMLMPFTIFFSSFEFTRGIGRSMIEQTLLWSSLQVFYGVTIVLIAVGITIVPPSMYNSYGIGLHKNDIPYVGAAMDKLDVRGDLFISIFSFTSMFLLFLGPLLMFTFFQKLLPP